jgi:hypothetical protein
MTEARSAGEGKQERPKRRFLCRLAATAAILAALASVWVWLSGEARRTEFPLKEVPIPDDVSTAIMYQGLYLEPFAGVKHYPQFKSAKPGFGEFTIADAGSPGQEGTYFFAVDESKGTGTGYDTVYLDANGDLDLTDDKPAKSHAPSGRSTGGDTSFDSITIPAAGDNGEDIAVAPRMTGFGDGSHGIRFLPATVRQGRVRIAGRTYTISLTRTDNASSRYDVPRTSLRLYRPDSAIRIGKQTLWYISPPESSEATLRTMYFLHGKWYSFSTTAAGDVITVHPYKGDLGVIRVSHDGNTAGNLIVQGSVMSDSDWLIALPNADPNMGNGAMGETPIPVGDYAPEWIQVRVGQFRLQVQSAHESRQGGQDAPAYFLKVRKDKPCMLDLASKADIKWLGRDRIHPFLPGNVVSVSPMLTTGDLLIQSVEFAPQVTPGGFFRSPKALQATVKIQDSEGKTLAEGTADFGYNWQIPKDFAPRGGKETLTVTATWDTKELFGVVTGTKEIVVESTDQRGGE